MRRLVVSMQNEERIHHQMLCLPTASGELFNKADGSVPTTYFLDRDGAIMFKHIGGGQWDHPWAVKFIRQLLR